MTIFSLAPFYMHAEETEQSEQELSDTADSAQQKLQANQQEIDAQQESLEDLEKKIADLTTKKDSATNQAAIASSRVKQAEQELSQKTLELKQTTLSIADTEESTEQIEQDIESLKQEIAEAKQQMSAMLRELYSHENTSVIRVLFGGQTFGDLFRERRAYLTLQDRVLDATQKLQEKQSALTNQQRNLEDQYQGLVRLQETQDLQQEELAAQRDQQQVTLNEKRQQEDQFKKELAAAKQARTEIEQQIFKLKGVGVEVKLNDAFEAAKFASRVTGVRPALILGVLKVETNVGQNLGSGKFPDDMHPGSRDAFIRITQQLDLDPQAAPISRRPTSLKGWGGAMGPGQFMPATWEGIQPRVASLMSKPIANPYELADAMVGTGIMLADRGAADRSKETEAVGRYLAGPNWAYHPWYSNRVLAIAVEYEKENF